MTAAVSLTEDVAAVVAVMDDKRAKIQSFLPEGKKESCAAEGCTRFLSALEVRSCICAALRPHMYY